MRLVADVGGTNARLALSDGGAVQPDTLRTYRNDDWSDFHDVVADFLTHTATPDQGMPAQEMPAREMVVAVAGPVHGDTARLTNRDWTFDTARLATGFGMRRVHLLNDLMAMGYSVPSLTTDQLRPVSDGTAQPNARQSLVVGIGTGFNVSPVLHSGGAVLCPPVEAGHVALPLSIARALAADGLSSEPFPTVEHLFSGRGLTQYCALALGEPAMTGPEAIAQYNRRDDVAACIDGYAAALGWLLRDLSLAYLPRSGMYFSGGVARAIMDTAAGPCLTVLRQPCPIRRDVVPPLWVIADDTAALTGCAAFDQF